MACQTLTKIVHFVRLYTFISSISSFLFLQQKCTVVDLLFSTMYVLLYSFDSFVCVTLFLTEKRTQYRILSPLIHYTPTTTMASLSHTVKLTLQALLILPLPCTLPDYSPTSMPCLLLSS
jgi:hypothetical protein